MQKEERRGEESKSGGYLLSQQGDRKTLNRLLPLRSSSSRPSIPLSSLFQVPIYFSNLASLLLRSVLSVAMLKAVSRPSIHSLPASPWRTYWTCLPSSSLSLWISHIIYFYTEWRWRLSLREMNPISPPRLDRKIRLCLSLLPIPGDKGLCAEERGGSAQRTSLRGK